MANMQARAEAEEEDEVSQPQGVLAWLAQAVVPLLNPKSKFFVFSAVCQAGFNQCKRSVQEQRRRKLCEHEGMQMTSPVWKSLKPAQLPRAVSCKTAFRRFSDFS